jgi:ABC-type branched-subunit amino acid transport system substrate-binding protein
MVNEMARPLRIQYWGAYYHVVNRGNNQEAYWQKYGVVYQKMYQRPVMQTAFGAYAYDATWIAALALKMAGSSDADDEIDKALHVVSKDYNGATGDKSFDQDGMQAIWTTTSAWSLRTED